MGTPLVVPAALCIGFMSIAGAAEPGYILVAPIHSEGAFLVDAEGQVVHEWWSEYRPGMGAYLLDNGNLLPAGTLGPEGNSAFVWGGAGGVVEEFDWEGNLVWRFVHSGEAYLARHDIEPMPNGNVLMTAWERKTRDVAIAAGRDPDLVGPEGMWPAYVFEVKPTPPEGGEIVWEWHVWDHLVQDRDPALPNYGDIASAPRRVNINPPDWFGGLTEAQREQLEALGYLGGPGAPNRESAGNGHARPMGERPPQHALQDALLRSRSPRLARQGFDSYHGPGRGPRTRPGFLTGRRPRLAASAPAQAGPGGAVSLRGTVRVQSLLPGT